MRLWKAPTNPSAPNDTDRIEGEKNVAIKEELKNGVIQMLKTCYDPEIPVNIYDLGLIYGIEIDEERNHVDVDMTLTSPNCPVAESLPVEVQEKVSAVAGIDSAKVNVVWEPPWDMQMMTEAAKLELGFM